MESTEAVVGGMLRKLARSLPRPPLMLSHDVPTVEGFYWLKKGGELTMRQVVKRGGALMVEQQNVLCSLDVFAGSKWAGPIPEPYEEPYDERESQP